MHELSEEPATLNKPLVDEFPFESVITTITPEVSRWGVVDRALLTIISSCLDHI